MSNIASYNSVKTDNINGHNSVKNSAIKTHCIVCNSAFLKPRAGKLYCSNSCKQFGYNHKELMAVASKPNLGKKDKTIKKFRIEDYARFNEMSADLKRFKDLLKKNEKFQEQQRAINIKAELGIAVNQDYDLSHFLLQLNKDEFYELQSYEWDYQDLKHSEAPNLSLEQWSFFKDLFKKLDEQELFRVICQLSKDFLQQLNLRSPTPGSSYDNLNVKKKYINHCNEIAEGLIRFI